MTHKPVLARSKSSPLTEAAKKNRPEIVELLQDAINRIFIKNL